MSELSLFMHKLFHVVNVLTTLNSLHYLHTHSVISDLWMTLNDLDCTAGPGSCTVVRAYADVVCSDVY